MPIVYGGFYKFISCDFEVCSEQIAVRKGEPSAQNKDVAGKASDAGIMTDKQQDAETKPKGLKRTISPIFEKLLLIR